MTRPAPPGPDGHVAAPELGEASQEVPGAELAGLEEEPAVAGPVRPSRLAARLRLAGGVALTAVLVIVAVGFVISAYERSDRGGAAPTPSANVAAARTVTGQIDGRAEAALHLVSGATVVTVRMAALGDTLLRVETPPDGDAVPRIVDPSGTVPVRVSKGAGDLVVRTPTTVPVRSTLNSGAGGATIDGEDHAAIAPGTVFTPDDWENTNNRYDLHSAGLGQLVVVRVAAP